MKIEIEKPQLSLIKTKPKIVDQSTHDRKKTALHS